MLDDRVLKEYHLRNIDEKLNRLETEEGILDNIVVNKSIRNSIRHSLDKAEKLGAKEKILNEYRERLHKFDVIIADRISDRLEEMFNSTN